jgi:hypothetical protein
VEGGGQKATSPKYVPRQHLLQVRGVGCHPARELPPGRGGGDLGVEGLEPLRVDLLPRPDTSVLLLPITCLVLPTMLLAVAVVPAQTSKHPACVPVPCLLSPAPFPQTANGVV